MFFTVYKITHIDSGKQYIGVHRTDDLNDGYLGSGKHIKRAVKRYGAEAFQKEILFLFENEEDMLLKEKELVDDAWVANPSTYNIALGGSGSFYHINNTGRNGTKRRLELFKDEDWKSSFIGQQHAGRAKMTAHAVAEQKSKRIQTIRDRQGDDAFKTFSGQKHLSSTIDKMREAHRGKHDGVLNSQYGSMWITDGKINRKIKKIDDIPQGWYKGRVMPSG